MDRLHFPANGQVLMEKFDIFFVCDPSWTTSQAGSSEILIGSGRAKCPSLWSFGPSYTTVAFSLPGERLSASEYTVPYDRRHAFRKDKDPALSPFVPRSSHQRSGTTPLSALSENDYMAQCARRMWVSGLGKVRSTTRMALLLAGIGLAFLLGFVLVPRGKEAQSLSGQQGLGLELRARIVSNISDPFGPVVVELVCKNVRESESVAISPFPEWGFNPIFLVRDPKGQLFCSVNDRYGPPPTRSVVLGPGQNFSKLFNLSDPPYPGRWDGISSFDMFSQAGEYQLTVVYRPFYHLFFINRTMADLTINTSLTFNRPRRLRILHLGTCNLSFLRRDLGSAFLTEGGPGPYPAIDEAIQAYDLLILDNVPPEWVGDSQALGKAVMERGLDLVIFGGPLSLGGNGSYSSWSESGLGDLLPVECTGFYMEIPSGARPLPVLGGQRDTIFRDLDTSNLNTIRHLSPYVPRPGATVWSVIQWDGRAPEYFLCSWPIGKSQVMVCAAPLEEILAWANGRQLVARIVEATIPD